MDFDSKARNRKRVLDAFRNTHQMTWTEVSEATGQSPSTVHRAIEFLRAANLLLVAGKGPSSDNRGKRPLILALNATFRHILCFHIQIACVTTGVTDLKARILAQKTVPFAPNAPLDTVLALMEQSYRELADALDLTAAGFAGVAAGCNGVVDAESGVLASSPNFSSWGDGIPLRQRVGAMFPAGMPIHLDNSNRFDAYAEYRIGQGRNIPSFMIIDGHADGFGAGVVLNGTLWRGKRHLSGEFGHITADTASDKVCYCGAKGCLEAIASMAALEEEARDGYASHTDSAVFSRGAPEDASYRAIYAAAGSGDAFARELVERQAARLAVGLNAAALLLDPDAIILQGSFVHGGEFFLEALRREVASLGLPRIGGKVDVRYSVLGPDRCLMGMAHYAADHFFQTPGIVMD